MTEPYAWQAVGGTIWNHKTSEDDVPLYIKPQWQGVGEHMTYEEFLDFVPAKCMYETIYDDSDGRTILVIRMLDAYKFITQWHGLTDDDVNEITADVIAFKSDVVAFIREAEAKLKEKNR